MLFAFWKLIQTSLNKNLNSLKNFSLYFKDGLSILRRNIRKNL